MTDRTLAINIVWAFSLLCTLGGILLMIAVFVIPSGCLLPIAIIASIIGLWGLAFALTAKD